MREYIDLFICLIVYSIIVFGLFQLAIWLQKEYELFN